MFIKFLAMEIVDNFPMFTGKMKDIGEGNHVSRESSICFYACYKISPIVSAYFPLFGAIKTSPMNRKLAPQQEILISSKKKYSLSQLFPFMKKI